MKSKMMAGGGMPMNPATGKPTFVGDGKGKMAKGGRVDDYESKRRERLRKIEEESRDYGREEGKERQRRAAYAGGPLGTPAAYVTRAGQYVGDKATDLDAFLSEKLGMKERAASRRGERQGLKDEGFKRGGMAKMAMGGGVKAKMGASKMGAVKTGKPAMGSASSRADGVAAKGKTKGKMLYGGGMAKMKAGGGVKAKMMAGGGKR